MDVFAVPAVVLAAYFAAGLLTGLTAGLLGVGGGLIMIPVLDSLFLAQGVPPSIVQHLALGTSLAAIIPTGFASARGHAARGAVEWGAARAMIPWLGLGALASAIAARGVSSPALQSLYVFLCVWVLYSLFSSKAAHDAQRRPLDWPRVSALVIGLLSGVLGIGGGSLSTPYLLRHGRDIRIAVGTAAALGVPIAAAGALGYLVTGMQVPGRPSWAVGFIDLQAVFGLVCGSLISTRWGVALAHRWPREVLKKAFALVILLAGVKMTWRIVAFYL